MTGTCSYCERPGRDVAPCCDRHPGQLACADVADCRDYLLAGLRAGQAADPKSASRGGFGEWLGELADYPLIADGSQERIYLRASEARKLLERAYAAGYELGRGDVATIYAAHPGGDAFPARGDDSGR